MTHNMFGQQIRRTPAEEVKAFHERDDVDSSNKAHHHTLGFGLKQAAPGHEVKKALDILVLLNNFVVHVGDVILRTNTVEDEWWKICNGQTLVGSYPELLALLGSLTLPDMTPDIPASFPASVYMMRVK